MVVFCTKRATKSHLWIDGNIFDRGECPGAFPKRVGSVWPFTNPSCPFKFVVWISLPSRMVFYFLGSGSVLTSAVPECFHSYILPTLVSAIRLNSRKWILFRRRIRESRYAPARRLMVWTYTALAMRILDRNGPALYD